MCDSFRCQQMQNEIEILREIIKSKDAILDIYMQQELMAPQIAHQLVAPIVVPEIVVPKIVALQMVVPQQTVLPEKFKNKDILTYTYQGKIIRINMLLSSQLLSIECVNVDTNELFTIKRTSVIPDVPSPPTINTANNMLYHLIHNYSKVKWMMRWPLTTAIWWVCSISFTDAFTNKALLNEVT